MRTSTTLGSTILKLTVAIFFASLVGCSSSSPPSPPPPLSPSPVDPSTTESVPESSTESGPTESAPGSRDRAPRTGGSGNNQALPLEGTASGRLPDRIPTGNGGNGPSTATTNDRPIPTESVDTEQGSVAPPPTQPVDAVQGPAIPPPGVPAQLDYFLGGDNPCSLGDYTPPSLPAIVPNDVDSNYTRDVLEVPESLEICFVGFSSSPDEGPLLVEISTPSGDIVLSHSFTPNEIEQPWEGLYPSRFYTPIPGSEKGEYNVSAKQGAALATWKFNVVSASTPRHVGMYGSSYDNSQNLPDAQPEQDFRTGQVVRVAFGGFVPNEEVAVNFYGPLLDENPGKVNYFGSLSFRVDATGEGIFEFEVVDSFPRGCFRIYNERVIEYSYLVQFCAV